MFALKSKKPEQTSARVVAEPADMAPAVASRNDVERMPAMICDAPQNVIGKGTVIQGNIVAEGDLLIEGTVRGDVTTKTTLIVGKSCVIEGNILADHAEVAGQVKGTVQALGLLIIKSSSMIDGDVLTKNLNVESGSTFNGRFTVGSVTSTNAPAKNEAPTLKSEAIKSESTKTENTVLGSDIRRTPTAAVTTPSKV
jgi:cytoskeletal protein CcmA (bactofilin family)